MNLTQIGQMTADEARAHFEAIRWPNGPVCVKCGDTGNVVRMKGKSVRPGLLRCRSCRSQFTVTVGTVFEDSHLPLNQWFFAIHLMCSSKKGFSALQLSRNLGITYRAAWHMAHRVRHAMNTGRFEKPLKGIVEVDETYVGGRRRGSKRGRGAEHKTPVVALVQRNGEVRTRVVANVTGNTLKTAIRENVHPSATIMTDEWSGYKGIGKEFKGGHKTVNHGAGEYVRGKAYTNTAECFFSLLKRGVNGVFHHVSRQHLSRYCDEFSFRWNHREEPDFNRTVAAISQAEGKRLMYHQPAGL